MSLVIETVSNSTQARKDLDQLNKAVQGIESTVQSASASFQKMALGIGAMVGAFATIKTITSFSDAFTELENRIRSVTDTQDKFTRAMEGVKDIAIQSRSGLREVASLYSRIAINAKDLGVNQRDVLRATGAVSKSMKLAGATASEANAAMLQFGQAIGSGTLQGDELRSLLENAPPLAAAIAKEFGTTVGNLKKLGEEGQLLSGKVLKAIINQAGDIDNRFAKLKVTFGEAFGNLGTATSLLFKAVTDSIFGSDGLGMAAWINDLAIGIKRVADNFKFYLLKIKTSILFFVVDSKQFFMELLPVIEKIGTAAVDAFKYLVDNWKTILSNGYDIVTKWASVVARELDNLFDNISAKGLVNGLIFSVSEAIKTVKSYIVGFFRNFSISDFSIDVAPWFKGFEPALNYIQGWVKVVERAFFWLYDQVIGHSWIPDLVIETGQWLKQLLGDPLGTIKKFTESTNGLFSGLSISGPIALATAAMKHFGKNMITVTALAAALVSSFTMLGYNGAFGDKLSDKIKSTFTAILNMYDRFMQTLDKKFGTTTLVRTVKQIFGVHDSVPGNIFGNEGVDTRSQARVGRGPQRSSENRSVGHDIINALPKDWQIPVLAGVAGVFGLAIAKAFDSGPVRSILLSGLTTAFGLAVARTVDDATIKKFTSSIGWGITDVLGRGIDGVLGKNALQDPFGTLSILAKSALLFKDGREAILSATKALVTAPTKLGFNISDAIAKKYADSKSRYYENQISALPARLDGAVVKAEKSYNDSIARLASLKDSTGNALGAIKAAAAVTKGQLDGINKSIESAKALQIAMQAGKNLDSAVLNRDKLAETVKDLEGKRAKMTEMSAKIGERLAATSEAFKEGMRTIGSGVGGTLGGLGGYQIGAAIARSMGDEVSNWQKVGITIGAAIVGQVAGSAVGSGISSLLIGAFSKGAGLVGMIITAAFAAAPVITIVAGLSLAFAAGYMLLTKLPDEWKHALGFQTKADEAKVASASKTFEDTAVKTQEENNKRIAELTEELKKANVGTNLGASLQSVDAYKNANMFDRQAIESAMRGPTNEERQANLETNRQIVASVTKFNATLGSFVNWLIGQKSDVTKRASGGWINGPGTNSSDSIPAMLSNGEFVVNAKSAGKNWKLLEAINSGKGTSFFSEGTSVGSGKGLVLPTANISPSNPLPVSDIRTESVFKQGLEKLAKDSTVNGKFDIGAFMSAIKDMAGKIPAMIDNKPKPPSADFTAPDTRSKFRRSLEGKDPSGSIATGLASAGVGGITKNDVSKMSLETRTMLVESLDNVSKAQEKMAKESSVFLKEQLQDNIGEQIDMINGILKKAAASGEAPSTWTESAQAGKKGKAPKTFNFGDQLKVINETFPKLGLTFEEFIKLTDQSREDLFQSAREIYDETTRINNIQIGVRDKKDKTIGDTKTLDGANESLRKNEEARKIAEKEAIASVAGTRSLFRNVEQLFQEANIGLTKSQINALLEDDANKLIEIASGLTELNKAQDALVQSDVIGRLDIATKITAQAEKLQNAVSIAIINASKGFDKTSALAERVKTPVERAVYNRMTDAEVALLDGFLGAIAQADDGAKNGATDEIRKAAQAKADASRKKAQDIIDTAAARTSAYDATNFSVSKAGGYLEKSLFNSMSTVQQESIRKTADEINSKQSEIDSGELDEAGRLAAQRAIDEMTYGMQDALEKGRRDRTAYRDASKAFASQVRSDFSGALSGLLKGQSDDNKSALETFGSRIMDSFTNSILDGFAKSATNAIMGDGSGIAKILEGIGGGTSEGLIGKIGGLFGGSKDTAGPTEKDVLAQMNGSGESPSWMTSLSEMFSGFTESFGGMFSSVASNFGEMFSGLGDMFSGLFSGFGDSLSSMFSSMFSGGGGGAGGGGGSLVGAVMSLFGYADGGQISGPGTSRSDSIPAMLSNGEFVVNAKSTKAFAPLLHSINSGSFGRFADGGLVGSVTAAQIDSISSTPAKIAPTSSSASKSSAVFNLNITGDVSSQTRSEIQKMIPQIAYGVNNHNYESGRSRR